MNPYHAYFRAFDDETEPLTNPASDNVPATTTGVQLDGYTIDFDQKVALTPVEVVATNPAPAPTSPPYGNTRY